MKTLTPYLIPILLISVQIINSIIYYMYDISSVFGSITLIVYIIMFIGREFESTRNSFPYWHSLFLDASVYNIIIGILVIGGLVTIETFPSSLPITYTMVILMLYVKRREPLSEKSDVE